MRFSGRFASATALVFGALTVLATGWPAEALAQGCAMCRTALEGQQGDPLTQAFNTSALFLMAMPYTVVGTFGVWIFLTSRRHAQDAGDELPMQEPLRPTEKETTL